MFLCLWPCPRLPENLGKCHTTCDSFDRICQKFMRCEFQHLLHAEMWEESVKTRTLFWSMTYPCNLWLIHDPQMYIIKHAHGWLLLQQRKWGLFWCKLISGRGYESVVKHPLFSPEGPKPLASWLAMKMYFRLEDAGKESAWNTTELLPVSVVAARLPGSKICPAQYKVSTYLILIFFALFIKDCSLWWTQGGFQ